MANQMLKGKVVVVGAGAKNLGGLISRTRFWVVNSKSE